MATAHKPGEVLFSAEAIRARVDELATRIQTDYEGQTLHLLAILRGAVPFLTDLSRRLTLDVRFDFLAVRRSGQEVRFLKDLDAPLAGRHVLLVEDIVNEGRTLRHVLEALQLREPATLRVCAMFNRPARRRIDVQLDYVGLELPDRFVVGYGLDHRQLYRNLPYVAAFPEGDEEDHGCRAT
ncbi:MAG: hypoxanthine phosphoribosyltransferase [Armatimonadetes bacterium]|nr:hypoxanthine phosphoribosyltransferase [Armatimonadota bacterium]